MPQDKWAIVQAMQAEGRNVFMVGDGLNDAAVLASADVSAAIGQASDLARLHAGALILSDRLASVVLLVLAARHAKSLMRQNIAWATAYNLIAIPLAALGIVPAWGAALGMSLSSLLVVGNSLRPVPWKRSFS
jgi:Cu2+-exporting ATPase